MASARASFRKEGVTNGKCGSIFSLVKYEHLVAGVSGGVISTLVLHPLDLIKIRFAVDDGVTKRPEYRGLLHAFRSIIQQNGFQGLYQGAAPNILGAGMSWGIYFFLYNAIKTGMQGERSAVLGASQHMLAAAEAGVVTLIITNPLWVIKTRLCLQYETIVPSIDSKKYYKGMFDALIKVYRYEGVRGLYKGFVPGMFGVSHGALQFMAYEELKKNYNIYRHRPSDAKFTSLEYLTFAALSKLFAASITYPYQVVRARLQDQHRHYDGVIDVLRKTWRYEGMVGFYKGLMPYLAHVTPNICIIFLLYEKFSPQQQPDDCK